MYLDLANYDMTKFVAQAIAQIRQKRQLAAVATEYPCNGAASVTIPVFSGGQATRHVPGADIPDYGGGVTKATIGLADWDAGTYLDYFLLDKNNFSYEGFVERTGIPAAVCQRMDQTILDALTAANGVPTIDSGTTNPLSLFADIEAMMDEQELYIPTEDRYLILPAAAKPLFFTDDKMMSNNYVQLQLNNISEGKIGKILGFNLIFLNKIKWGGLESEPADCGANRLWTCYATSKVSIGHAAGYGANRSDEGTGGVFDMEKMAHRGGYFINAPFSDGAKVLLPKGIVRFTIKTKNYSTAA
ncbi:MAG: hypothetical protein LBP65_01880 [Puniceicoccales bacterium]|jgi:hypothetical protein|nr:hypothetical protein [Puniceicoccales bacterium]